MTDASCVELGAKQIYTAQGVEVEIDQLKTYKTGSGKTAIVFFTDIFGFALINSRRVADFLAEKLDVTVLIPDLFEGDPIDPNDPNRNESLISWRERHPFEKTCPMAERFVSSIENQFQSIFLIGFCYGGKITVDLIIKEKINEKIRATAVGHPSRLVETEAELIRRPILFLCAETDHAFPSELRQNFEKILSPTGLSTFIDYPGTSHGFVIRPEDKPEILQQRDKALDDAVQFFRKYL